MSLKDETELFARIAKKSQKNLMLSRELLGVIDDVVDDGNQSSWVEEACWQALVDEHGAEAIREAIEEIQDEIEPESKLPEAKSYSLPA